MSRSETSELLQKALSENNLILSSEIFSQLLTYIDLIQEWGSRINITGHQKVADIVYKDIIDNLTTIMYIISVRLKMYRVADFGCGAGYFGLLLKLVEPGVQVGLFDTHRKKTNFCRQVCRTLKLTGVEFHQHHLSGADDLKKLSIEPFDIVVTRATWDHQTFIKYAKNYVRNCGQSVHMLGREECKKIRSPQIQQGSGLQESFFYDYTIKPKNYERRLIIEKKIEPQTGST